MTKLEALIVKKTEIKKLSYYQKDLLANCFTKIKGQQLRKNPLPGWDDNQRAVYYAIKFQLDPAVYSDDWMVHFVQADDDDARKLSSAIGGLEIN